MAAIFDETDKKILNLLQQDASLSNLELSKQVGLSPSACLARTRNLRESGVIKQYAAIVDEERLGMETVAFVLVNLSPLNRDTVNAFVEEMKRLPQVLECYTLAGTKDYLLKIVAKDMKAYRDYVVDAIMSLPYVSRMETSMVITTDKRELALPIE